MDPRSKRHRLRRAPATQFPLLDSYYPLTGRFHSHRNEIRFANDIVIVVSQAKHPTASKRLWKQARDMHEPNVPVMAFVEYAGMEAERVYLSRQSFEQLMVWALDSDPTRFLRPLSASGKKDSDD